MKNVIIIFLLLFLNSCGYTSVYKNQGSDDLQINITEMKGDNEFNNLIKNEINLYSNVNSENKFDININSNYEKIIISKNSSGVAIDYKIIVVTKIAVNIDGKIVNMEFKENNNIKNNSDSFEQNNYEKNLKKNFASSVREKLMFRILNFNDN